MRARLPDTWSIERSQTAAGDEGGDALITMREPNGAATQLVVEAKTTIRPRDVAAMASGLARALRRASPYVQILVVAPWLSPRTQEALTADDLNYLDLTGNVRLQLSNPTVFITTMGAARDPSPRQRAGAGLRGAKAARLIRALVDVRPPYNVGDLAAATALTPGYVSRLLDTLDREAIVERGRRGSVEDVDVAALLRAWAESYDVFKDDVVTQWIAPGGARSAAADLDDAPGRVAITGLFAAVRLAPVAAPSQLVAYADDIDAVAEHLRLLPADEAANVVLLRPFDEVVWRGTASVDGLTYAAPTQVAVDCLTGGGRMPSEGEALLELLLANDDWRLDELPRWP